MNIKGIRLDVIPSGFDAVEADSAVSGCPVLNQESIRETAAGALLRAQEQRHRTILFSDFGSSKGGFPLTGVAKIFIQEIMRYARMYEHPSLEKVIFCIPDGQAFQTFDKTARAYLKHLQDALGGGPYVTVDIIIELDQGIILIDRLNPPYGWALPGGFLDYGESLEDAAIREAKEETNTDLVNLRQFHTYSRPDRDPRFQTVATVFIAEGRGTPQSGDDAKGVKIVRYEDLLELDYAFDHKDIIKEYLIEKNLD